MQDQDEARQGRDFRRADESTPDGAPVKTAVKARQGLATGRMLVVLAAALALVVIGFAASYVGAV